MTEPDARTELAERVLRLQQTRHQVRADPLRAAAVTAVKQWQADRLARTHADWLASDRYRLAAQFFLDDLYGPKDVSGRDADIARIVPKLVKILPRGALRAVEDAVLLDELSERLDGEMAEQLLLAGVWGATPSSPAISACAISHQAYAAAFRTIAIDYRRQQLALVLDIGELLEHVVKMPLLRQALKLMGGPAQAAGLQTLHSFLVRGFDAFKAMGGAQLFLKQIEAREGAQIERVYAGGLPD